MEEGNIGWRLIEEVVALLERSLSPLAKVEHNVQLPVLGKSRTRQCDVVITSGEYPRQTISIVEVQKRVRKPDINTFHGWCRKMQEVGAQHLICVSVRGYPQSIIDEVATRCGPTVRLLTLDQLTEAKIPIFDFILPYMFHQKAFVKSLTVTQLGAKRPMESAEQAEPVAVTLTFTERIFSVPDSEARLSIIDIGKQVLDRNLDAIIRDNGIVDFNNFTVNLNLAPYFPKLWIHRDDRKIQILDLVINLGIQLRVTRIPVTFYEYTQQFVEGALSWVAVAKASINEVETDVRMVFKKNAEGYLEYQAQLLSGGNTLSLDFSVSPALNNVYYRFSEPLSS